MTKPRPGRERAGTQSVLCPSTEAWNCYLLARRVCLSHMLSGTKRPWGQSRWAKTPSRIQLGSQRLLQRLGMCFGEGIGLPRFSVHPRERSLVICILLLTPFLTPSTLPPHSIFSTQKSQPLSAAAMQAPPRAFLFPLSEEGFNKNKKPTFRKK